MKILTDIDDNESSIVSRWRMIPRNVDITLVGKQKTTDGNPLKDTSSSVCQRPAPPVIYVAEVRLLWKSWYIDDEKGTTVRSWVGTANFFRDLHPFGGRDRKVHQRLIKSESPITDWMRRRFIESRNTLMMGWFKSAPLLLHLLQSKSDPLPSYVLS